MPRMLENREELKRRMLRLLSADARMSVQDIASQLKTSKATAYNLFQETVDEYGIRFVPEIDIGELWRHEFVKIARTCNKKEILEDVVERLPEVGLEEYVFKVKFSDRMPTEQEVGKAAGDSYMPQLIARVRGDYDYVMYALARNYDGMLEFASAFSKRLDKYNMSTHISRVKTTYGFFPMRTELLKKLSLFDTYLCLLLGLSENGRTTLSDIGRNAKKKVGAAQMLYAYERLRRTGILKRVTYYETKPKNVINAMIEVKVTNHAGYISTEKMQWYMNMIRDYTARHNEYTYIGETSSPIGAVIFASFESGNDAETFVGKLRKMLKGSEIRYMTLTKTVIGSLGVRDFDMRYSPQYQYLERARMAPRFSTGKAAQIEQIVEDPDPSS